MDTIPPNDTFVHWVWFDDPDETLCGLIAKKQSWAEDNEIVDCPRCISADEFCKELLRGL